MGREERQRLLEVAKAKRRAREASGLPGSPSHRTHPMVQTLQMNEAATSRLEQELASKTDEAARVRISSPPLSKTHSACL